MKYSLVSNLLVEAGPRWQPPQLTRAALGALDDLCAQYVGARTDTQRGNLGEAIALIFLGLSETSSLNDAQSNVHNTNKWGNDFPFIDIMDKNLTATSSLNDVLSTNFYSVKTGNSTQNFRSLHRIANLPSSGGRGSKGLRDLIGFNYGAEKLELNVGYIHIGTDSRLDSRGSSNAGESIRVILTICAPKKITWERVRGRNALAGLRREGINPRGSRVIDLCASGVFYHCQDASRTGGALSYWGRPDVTMTLGVVSGSDRQSAEADLLPPLPGRRTIFNRLSRSRLFTQRVRNSAAQNFIMDNRNAMDIEFFEEYARLNSRIRNGLEELYNQQIRAWENQHRNVLGRMGRNRPRAVSWEQERDAARQALQSNREEARRAQRRRNRRNRRQNRRG